MTAAVIAIAAALGLAGAPHAAAVACNDVEVVFARGTNEPVGVGRVGDAFITELRNRVPNRSIGVYAVNYPAS
ncbi:MAG: cutinase family protein, partial [Mycobacterium sp.]|nr:cutinase family protein [Mycobacterium sp.]